MEVSFRNSYEGQIVIDPILYFLHRSRKKKEKEETRAKGKKLRDIVMFDRHRVQKHRAAVDAIT